MKFVRALHSVLHRQKSLAHQRTPTALKISRHFMGLPAPRGHIIARVALAWLSLAWLCNGLRLGALLGRLALALLLRFPTRTRFFTGAVGPASWAALECELGAALSLALGGVALS